MVIEKICIQNQMRPSFNFPRGWGNGYIGLPKEHPLYGVHYDDYDKYESYHEEVHPHGGWTYSDFINPSTHEADGLWWFGFDTAHSGDNENNCSERYVRDLVNALADAYNPIDIKLEALGF